MRHSKKINVLLVAIAAIIAYFCLIPLVFMVFTSFKGMSESIASATLLPKIWTLDNYVQLLGDVATAPVFRWMLNTAVVTVIGTLSVLVVDVLAAYALSRLHVPFAGKIITMIIWVMTIPGIVTLFPSFYMFKNLGLLNGFLPLMLPYTSNAMGVFLIYNFLKDFPVALEEAAIIDGASLFTVLRKVIFPSIKPVVMTLGFITFLNIYNDYLWPSIVIQNNDMKTLTVGIGSLVMGANFVNPGVMMAATVFAVFPALVLFLMVNKYIVKGVTNVGIK
ncbi:MAG: carbohydrate ABC transporter permease [Eubacteriales bacterium]|nr:carbohydrate ABC transporter permease [Eubacteriales bacterium]